MLSRDVSARGRGGNSPAVPRFTWTAVAASIVAGLSLGAVATVGATLLAQGGPPAVRKAPAPVVSTVVQYGDRLGADPRLLKP